MMTAIEWTDATWNPTTGCTKVSPGCAHCYIERTVPFRRAGRKFVKGTIPLQLHPDRLDMPLHWKRPRMVFVNSMSDLFHDDVPDEFIDRVFAVMNATALTLPLRSDSRRWHTYQVLTKRPERMAEYMLSRSTRNFRQGEHPVFHAGRDDGGVLRGHGGAVMNAGGVLRWPPSNVWLGASVEDQKRADERIPHLLRCPAAVRFLSCEPLLGPVDLSVVCDDPKQGQDSLCFLNWVIAGGESGPGARPMHPEWVRSARDQCASAGVAFFFKQWGDWCPADVLVSGRHNSNATDIRIMECGSPRCEGEDCSQCASMFRVGKKLAGRLLDGVEHSAFPTLNPQPSTLNP